MYMAIKLTPSRTSTYKRPFTCKGNIQLSIVVTLQLTIFVQLKHLFSITVIFNCHHFETDHLHEYVQFTRYHLQVLRVHLQCCEAQPISAISSNTCTLKLQLLHNTERPTKWSGHGKMIGPPWRTFTYERPFTQVGHYLVTSLLLTNHLSSC